MFNSVEDPVSIMNNTNASMLAVEVPAPAAAWVGLIFLGGLALTRYRRSKNA